jgi:hypothetical protein
MCHMPRPSHTSWFDHPNISRGLQIIKLLITQSSPLPCYFVPLSPKYFLSNLSSNTLSLCSSVNVRDQVSRPYKTTGKIILLYILIFIFFWIANCKTKDSAPNDKKHSRTPVFP